MMPLTNKKPDPITHADVLFALQFVLVQLGALRELAVTAMELTDQEIVKTTWTAVIESIETQRDVVSRLTVVWPQ